MKGRIVKYALHFFQELGAEVKNSVQHHFKKKPTRLLCAYSPQDWVVRKPTLGGLPLR